MTLTDPIAFVTEKQFQANVRELAVSLGWHVVGAAWNSRHSPDGEPDLRLCRERVVWAELKAAGGKLSKAQKETIEALKAAGAEVYVWFPSDWEEIVGVLGTNE